MRSKTHNDLLEGEEDKSEPESFPHKLTVNEEVERLKAIHEFIQEYRQEIADRNNKGDQYEDPEEDNVYAEVAEPEPEVVMAEMEVQTEQEKGLNTEQEKALDLKRKQMRDSIIEDIMNRKKDEQKKLKKKKKFRRGRRSFYENAIMEEDQESGKSDNDDVAQRLVPTVFENKPDDIMTLAMQIEKHNSLTQLWDLNQSEHERV